jgi:hypothetical protein
VLRLAAAPECGLGVHPQAGRVAGVIRGVVQLPLRESWSMCRRSRA